MYLFRPLFKVSIHCRFCFVLCVLFRLLFLCHILSVSVSVWCDVSAGLPLTTPSCSGRGEGGRRDAMKFGREFVASQDPRFRTHYIDYVALKKVLSTIKKMVATLSALGTDNEHIVAAAGHSLSQFTGTFVKMLDDVSLWC